jgi:hypothetical protein
MKSIKLLIIIVIGVILMSGCEQIDIAKYEGDGKISIYGNKLFYPGFEIEFDEFDLSNKFSNQYKLTELPEIDKRYVFGLYVQSNASIFEDEIDGILRLKLSNDDGVIFNVNSELKNWRKSIDSSDNNNNLFLSYYDINNFTSFKISDLKNRNEMTLIVDFTPYKYSSKLTAKVLLRAGGSK